MTRKLTLSSLSLAILFGLLFPLAIQNKSVAHSAERKSPLERMRSVAEACAQMPEYHVGGAAIGDCLLNETKNIDIEIEARLREAENHFCSGEDRADITLSQALWKQQRDTECALATRSPDNTPSYVNGAACRLIFTYQRLANLSFLTDYTSPRCP